MEEKLLKVLPTCTRLNFGLQTKLDPQYGHACVLDVDAKSSAAKLFSSLLDTQWVIRLSYIVEITGHRIFSKSEATTPLCWICDEVVCEFYTTFTNEPTLTKKQQRHNANEFALFDLCTMWKSNELPTNDLNRVNTEFSSSNRIIVTDDCAQPWVHPDTAKLQLSFDLEDLDWDSTNNHKSDLIIAYNNGVGNKTICPRTSYALYVEQNQEGNGHLIYRLDKDQIVVTKDYRTVTVPEDIDHPSINDEVQYTKEIKEVPRSSLLISLWDKFLQ